MNISQRIERLKEEFNKYSEREQELLEQNKKIIQALNEITVNKAAIARTIKELNELIDELPKQNAIAPVVEKNEGTKTTDDIQSAPPEKRDLEKMAQEAVQANLRAVRENATQTGGPVTNAEFARMLNEEQGAPAEQGEESPVGMRNTQIKVN